MASDQIHFSHFREINLKNFSPTMVDDKVHFQSFLKDKYQNFSNHGG